MKIGKLFTFGLSLIFLSVMSASPQKSSLPSLPKTKVDGSDSKGVVASSGVQLPKAVKLLIGAGGIYTAFLYYGTLQEDVFHYKASDGSMFKAAWFLQALGKITLNSNQLIKFANCF